MYIYMGKARGYAQKWALHALHAFHNAARTTVPLYAISMQYIKEKGLKGPYLRREKCAANAAAGTRWKWTSVPFGEVNQ